MKKLFIILFYSLSILSQEKDSQLKIGNQSLPSSQQPGPLFSFGQNIVDKHDFQIYSFLNEFKGENISSIGINPNILYGITDNLSLFAYLPYSINKINNIKSSGIGNIYLQGEYAFYTKSRETYTNQATILANIIFDTGSTENNPPLGINTPGFFIGATAYHLAIDWYYFASLGIQVNTKKNFHWSINDIFCQCGIGRNIAYCSNKWLLTWLVEFNFIHEKNFFGKNHNLENKIDILFIGPSLFFSTQRLTIQAGISFPLFQHFSRQNNKFDFYGAIDIGWKFN